MFNFSLYFQINFRQRFQCNFLLQMLEILTYYLLRHAIPWDLFVPLGCELPVKCRLSRFLHFHIRPRVFLVSTGSQIYCFPRYFFVTFTAQKICNTLLPSNMSQRAFFIWCKPSPAMVSDVSRINTVQKPLPCSCLFFWSKKCN